MASVSLWGSGDMIALLGGRAAFGLPDDPRLWRLLRRIANCRGLYHACRLAERLKLASCRRDDAGRPAGTGRDLRPILREAVTMDPPRSLPAPLYLPRVRN